MSVYATNRASAGHIPAFFSAVLDAVVAWNDTRMTRNALSRLSDRELDDIGLSRSDIDSISAHR